MFTKRNEKLQEDINKLTVTRQNLLEEIKKQESKTKQSTEIIPRTQQLLDSYDIMTPQQKNDLWKEVIYQVTYRKTEKKGRFDTTLYPKLPQKSL